MLAASLPPDLQDLASQLHAGDLDSLAVVISTERTARCARVEMLFLAQVSGLLPFCCRSLPTKIVYAPF